ncbi:MAG: 2Fe-2S iron-sulfur cluster-binding protein [Candidatus Aminicenantes bacterium]|jgi:NADH-quinone oxidoreductase subunit G
MVKIFIDGKPVESKEGTTIFNAAQEAGISIPHLCYHPAFEPEGTCRMCLVEIEGVPKLELACATRAREGMKVFTKNERVIEARKGVLEFLLAEHPLDCPICDQAGECKLQDYYEEYGLFDSQFSEVKEKRRKKARIGKNLLHDQERCVLCRRCVRFLKEVTGTCELGVFERGNHTEVNILDENGVDNNYSGNLAELCPVGAITDSDFRFKTRSWFLAEGDSICPHCSRGCNISIHYNSAFHRFPVPKRVFRVQTRQNPDVNGYWICDFGRYSYSYLDENRSERISVNTEDIKPSWDPVIGFLADKIKRLKYMNRASRISLILNTWLTNEELFLVKKLFLEELGAHKVFFHDPPQGEADDLLMTAERTPNRRGAEEIGFEINPLDWEVLSDQTELLLIFGQFLGEGPNLAEIKARLGSIKNSVLFTSHSSELNELVDVILPTSAIPEKAGSLTNVDGIVQGFSPVLESVGESRPEWKILLDLAKEAKANFGYFGKFASPKDILEELRKDKAFFKKRQ